MEIRLYFKNSRGILEVFVYLVDLKLIITNFFVALFEGEWETIYSLV
jgi:hypothetical protein